MTVGVHWTLLVFVGLAIVLGIIGAIRSFVDRRDAPTPTAPSARTDFIGRSEGHAAASRDSGLSVPDPERRCPFCAEMIKAAAVVCRYCGRDVDPASPDETGPSRDERIAAVAEIFPAEYAVARPYLEALDQEPGDPVAWLTELCRRIQAGAPPDRAAQRIALDWGSTGETNSSAAQRTAERLDPSLAGEYPSVASAFPAEYDTARSVLAGLYGRPTDPAAWLAELCRRIAAGSPAEAAASRIALDWPVPSSHADDLST